MFGRLSSAFKSVAEVATGFAHSFMQKKTEKTIDFLPPAVNARNTVRGEIDDVFMDETPGTEMFGNRNVPSPLDNVVLDMPVPKSRQIQPVMGETYGMGIKVWELRLGLRLKKIL